MKYKLRRYIYPLIIGLIAFSTGLGAPGDLDLSFSEDGKLVQTIGTPINVSDRITDIVIQPDGKILALGNGFSNGNFCIIARYLTDGSIDQSFGSGGKMILPFAAIMDIALQADGKIVIAGATNASPADMFVARFNSDGSVDATFDGDGQVSTDFGGSDIANAVAIQPDGKIVAAGSRPFGSADIAVARYHPDGSLDRITIGTTTAKRAHSKCARDAGQPVMSWRRLRLKDLTTRASLSRSIL